jgi:hypothetical protein
MPAPNASAKKGNPREISRIEILVHPFYDFYNSLRAKGFQPASAQETTHLAGKWKQRIREIASDPNAILVIVRSAYEMGLAKPSFAGHSGEEIKQIKAIEADFYAFAKKCLERKARDDSNATPANRLFLGLEEDKYAGTTDRYIDQYKFLSELEKRNMKVGGRPELWAYGGYTLNCVAGQFRKLCWDFFPWKASLKFKIIESLSLPLEKNHKGITLRRARGIYVSPWDRQELKRLHEKTSPKKNRPRLP